MRFPTSTRPLINLPVRGVGLLGLALVVSCSGLEDDSLTEPRFEGVVPPHITKDPGAAPDHTAPVDDIAPEPIIGIVNPDGSNNQQCGRLGGVQFKTFLVLSLFVLMFTAFGVSSFLRARRIARGKD